MTHSHPANDHPEATSPQAPKAPLRLSIAHLLLWMTTTAFAMATFPADFFRFPIYASATDREVYLREVERQQTIQKLAAAAIAPFYGAALASLAVAAVRKVRGQGGFPTHPGHWLLLHIGLAFLAYADAYHLGRGTRYVVSDLLNPAYDPVAILLLFVCVGQLIVAIGAAVQTPAKRWKAAFSVYLAAVITLIIGVLPLWQKLEGAPLVSAAGGLAAIAIVLALVAVLRDLWLRAAGDPFHWLGVVVLGAAIAHLPLTKLATRLALGI